MLCAGLGTRLRPLTDERAKPAMPVAGEPIIRRIAAWLASHGVADLVLNLHHRPESIAAAVGDGSDLGVSVRYSWEQPTVLGSAGGPRHALPMLDADPFLLINGDTLTNVDLARLASAHAASGALVTLALVPNREFLRYGGVLVDGGGAVTGFSRRGPESEKSWHFVGVQCVSASVFAPLPADVPSRTIGGAYDELIWTRPGAVRAFQCDADFFDVGTAADYLRTSLAFSASGVDVGHGTQVDGSARLTRCVLWDDVTVEAKAELTDCIVADGVTVPADAQYHGSILMNRNNQLTVSPLSN